MMLFISAFLLILWTQIWIVSDTAMSIPGLPENMLKTILLVRYFMSIATFGCLGIYVINMNG